MHLPRRGRTNCTCVPYFNEVATTTQIIYSKRREKDVKERARQVAETEMKEQKDNLRMRYSAEVPILKDMGEEVMERVDFPPRIKGGECA